MAIRVVTDQSTFVKKITVGTPIRSVSTVGNRVNFLGDSGSSQDFITAGSTDVISFQGDQVLTITTEIGNKSIKFDVDVATTDSLGVAKFDSDHFTVTSGNVRINMLDSNDQVTHDLVPNADSALDLGSASNKWRSLYLSGNTIYLGNIKLEDINGTFTIKDSDGNIAPIDLSAITSDDVAEGSTNIYYTTARFDSDLASSTAISNVRTYFSAIDAGGDGSFTYDSGTGAFTYTGPSDLEVRAHFAVSNDSGDGTLSYDSATGTFTLTGVTSSQTRSHFSGVDVGGDGSFSYDSSTGTFTYTGPSAAETRQHFSATADGGDGNFQYNAVTGEFTYTGPSAVETRAHFSVSNDSGDGTLSYDSASGVFTLTGVTPTQTRAHFSAVDAGGDGSFSYDSSTGAFTYVGPTPEEVRAHLAAGVGTHYDSATGVISIGQPVETTSDVTFNDITAQGNTVVLGNLTVQGTTTTVNSTEVTINDKNLVLADSATGSVEADGAGLTIGGADFIGTKPTITYSHTNTRWELNIPLNVSGGISTNTIATSSLTSDSAVITDVAATNLDADSGTITTFTYSNASGINFSADSTGTRNLSADTALLDTIDTTTITAGTINVDLANIAIEYVDSAIISYAEIAELVVNAAEFDSAHATSFSMGTVNIDAANIIDSATISHLAATTFNLGTGIVDSAVIDGLSGTTANFSDIIRSGATDYSGTWGSASLIPIITVDSSGFIDSIGTTSVAGVTDFQYDSSNGDITISTADGNSFTTTVNLNPFTTTNLVEGDNLYYTKVRVDSDVNQGFTDRSTTDLVEGDNLYYTKSRVDSDVNQGFTDRSTTDLVEGNNLYYTKARVDSDVNQGFTDRSTTDLVEGDNLYYTKVRVDSDVNQGFVDRTTTDLAEGDNLYYTTSRADSDFDVRLATKTTTDVAEGNNLYYTKGRVDSDVNQGFVDRTTTDLVEGNNLYYTKARVDSDVNQGFTDRTTTDLAEGNNLYYTTARADSDAKNAISVVDAGGDGSLSYNTTNGQITYTGPSASEVRAHFSGGTGVSITDGTIAIGQSVGTADSVVFSGLSTSGNVIVGGDLYVNGTTTTVNSTEVQIADKNINIAIEATNNTEANGSGITVGDSNYSGAAITYDGITDRWDFNKPIEVTTIYAKVEGDSATITNISATSINTDSIQGGLATFTDIVRTEASDYSGTWGSASLIPVITVDASGFIDSIGTTSVAGVTNFTYDSATGQLVISTADGGSYDATVTLDPFTTSNLTEGGNLYYTTSRADSDFDVRLATKSTTDLTEGNNLYYTKIRVDSDVNQGFTDRSTTDLVEGDNLYYTKVRVDSDVNQGFADRSTTDLVEGDNLYYTKVRVDSDVNQGFVDRSTTNLVEGDNLYYTKVRVDSDVNQGFVDRSTTDLVEGSNLYYTKARVDSDVDQGFTDRSTTDLIEGDNLYYTKVRVDSDVAQGFTDRSTTDLVEGNNLYYTTARADSDFDVRLATKSTDDVAEGNNLYYTTARFDSDFADNTTTDLAEGNNLYYTTDRADSDFDARLATKSTTDLAEGDNLYYTKVRVDSDVNQGFADRSTTDLVEGSNLYYTTARADSDAKNAISVTDNGGDGSLSYTPATGVISYTGPSAAETRAHFSGGTGVTITDGVVAIGQNVGTTSDVTFAKTTTDSAVADNVSTNYIDFTPADPGPAHVEGRVYYNDEYKALTVYNDIVGSSLQVGLEEWTRVYNNSGSQINNGTPVYATGSIGETLTVAPADATTEAKARVLGVATHNIPNNSEGVVTIRGLISGIDTSNLTAGQPVHLSPTGTLQTAAPTYPYWPVDLGGCVVQDSSNGYVYIRVIEHHFESFRVSGNTHLDGNLTVDGDLVVNGSQSVVNQANLAIDNSFIYLNSGNTIGDANTTFSGTGLDDAYFTGHYNGTTTKTFYVRIDGVGVGAGGVDTFEWSYDSDFASTEATDVDITGDDQELADNVNIFFNATTGHTSGDTWYGTAAPVNVDTGWFTNRNTGATGVGYTHLGIFYDVSDDKFKVVNAYRPEPEGTIDTSDSSYSLGTFTADTFEGNLIGNVTGTVSSINNHTTTELAEGNNLYYTTDRADSDAKAAISVTDTGGDGSLTYTDGVITYTGPSASEVRAHFSASTGISITDGAISTNDAQIVHDNLSGFVANEHIDHTTVSITAGNGLTGGGTIAATRTLNIGQGTGITVNADTIQTNDAQIVHDDLSGFVANEHIDHTTVSITAGTGLTGGGTIAATRTINVDSAGFFEGYINHDNLTGFVANEHIDHTSVSISAGFGLIGGGNIAANRTLSVDSASITGLFSAAGDLSYSNGEFSFNETYSTAGELLTAIKTVDGGASGLDADLLDGQQGSYYRIDVYDATGTLLN